MRARVGKARPAGRCGASGGPGVEIMAGTFAQRGARSFRNRMPKATGETVLLRRGSDIKITVEGAMRSPNSVSIMGDDGLEVHLALTDWWLPSDAVLLDPDNPANNEPRAGDVVVSLSGEEFEGMRPSAGTPAVTSVCIGFYYVLHTKQTKAVA